MSGVACVLSAALSVGAGVDAAVRAQPAATLVRSLDGAGWLLATDPRNVGREQRWWEAPRPDAKPAKVPWIIQDTFPGYHGVAWYWRDFAAPANPHRDGRDLLRFWAVDYTADVWLNDVAVGTHEGGESPFTLDVTGVLRPGASNRLAVRVLNPTHQPIDGIVLAETPHRNKALPYTAGNAWNQGGIMDSVELRLTPALRVEDLFVRPDWKTGAVRIQAGVRNAASNAVRGRIEFAVAPAASGATLVTTRTNREFAAGDSLVEIELAVPEHRLWDLHDPFLYRVAARVQADGAASFDEHAERCGFRDFRFADGCFRLNGRRLFLRCSHTGNCCPIGLELPHDPDLLRRDLLNVKVMGFNAIRFISGVAKRYQLDLCDDIGLLVYEEAYASWCLADSSQMARRYDESILGMGRRDRNHPSVVLWGLLNETPEGAVFRHAAAALPRVRALDDTRVVMLNSGGWHESGASALAGLQAWRRADGPDPNVTHNPLTVPLVAPWATWAPGRLAFHPGPKNEFSVVRWTAPEAGGVTVEAGFSGPENKPTTDVHVLHNGRAVFDGWLNLRESGNAVSHTGRLDVARGDTVDFVVGAGNGNYGGDTTGLEAVIRRSDGKVFDAAVGFVPDKQPGRVWTYGWLAPGAGPDAGTFTPYPVAETNTSRAIGALSNPGSTRWEDVVSDQHPYQRVPHTADIIRKLRTMGGGRKPLFISEYGIGSAVDLWRATRHYERLGATHAMDAQFYRDKLDRFLADWERWRMAEAFGRPEDFFAASHRRMAGQRLLGLNAIRANPHCIGYSLTGTVDQGMTGEGLFTTFRELKPGTVDAVFDGLAPLRWCLFVEPVNFYRGAKARLEAVLANEDQLAPGEYPVRLEVFGPANQLVWSRRTKVMIAGARGPFARPPGTRSPIEGEGGSEGEFVVPVLAEDVAVDGPAGTYRFAATFESGAAPAGGEVGFFVADPAQRPAVEAEVVLWGDDPAVAQWLTARGVRRRPFRAGPQTQREVILAGQHPPAPGGAEAFGELARHLARGSTAIFLSPSVFAQGEQRTRWAPLPRKGSLNSLSAWLYHKDEWAKPHPIFDGLPTGMLDYAFYRELIPDVAWAGQDAPAEAVCGANDCSIAYASGLLVSVHQLGAGRFILNTLRLREHLGQHPAADRLLANLLRYASSGESGPPAALPADFTSRLQALGYE